MSEAPPTVTEAVATAVTPAATAVRWAPTDGPIRNVFSSKPPGHRCLWTCRWTTDQGIVTLERLINLAAADRRMLFFTLSDLAAQGHGTPGVILANLPAEPFTEGISWHGAENEARAYILSVAESLPEYFWPANFDHLPAEKPGTRYAPPPKNVIWIPPDSPSGERFVRPGWGVDAAKWKP